MFFVRMQQETTDGTIPFGQATEMMNSIQRMVRAAATTTANPRHSHRGRRPSEVKEFMDDSLRFGHTKRGSFIITVASRLPLDSVGATVSEDHPEVRASQAESSEADHLPPFERRVIRTLAAGLEATKKMSIDPEALDDEKLNAAGVSLELVQAVLDIANREGLQQVDMDFEWASLAGDDPDVERVTFASAELPKIAEFRDRLVRQEPVPDVTLMGRVAELSRQDVGNGQEETVITLEADLLGRMRKVRVPLIASDYSWAIFAHQERLPFTVSGTPKKARSWELSGIVKADLDFLKAEAIRRGAKPS